MNFVSKKLILEIDSSYDEEVIINEVINLIDSIEPGLDIQVLGKTNKSYIKKDIVLGGLNCAHCAEVIGNKVSSLDGSKKFKYEFC